MNRKHKKNIRRISDRRIRVYNAIYYVCVCVRDKIYTRVHDNSDSKTQN